MSSEMTLNLEHQKEQSLKAIKLREACKRLLTNKDFKDLILTEFCLNECARYTHTSIDFNLPTEVREDALAFAQSSGYLKKYLQLVVQIGDHAESQLGSINEAIAEAEQEDDVEVQ